MRIPVLLAALTLLVALPVKGESADSVADADAAQLKKGATSYRKRCARCHGVKMVNPGPGIFDLRTFPKEEKSRFVDSVINGKNAMPSWGDVLDENQVDDLWVYITQ